MLTIITINLNNINGLKITLDSILQQYNKNFELVFIDGGSTDGSIEFLSNFDSFLRIKKIVGLDRGIYNAMNIAIPLIDGDCAIYLNSGDFFYDRNSIDIILRDLPKSKYFVNLYSSIIYGKLKMPKKLFYKYWSLPTSHQSIVYAKNVLKKYFYDENYLYSSDFDHFIRISNDSSIKINFNNEIIGVNIEYGSIKNLDQIKKEYYQIISNYFPFYISYIIVFLRFIVLKIKGF